MRLVAPAISGLLIDVLGYLTGAVVYLMLVAMVWRERSVEGTPFLYRLGRLPLLTGVCGVVWNVGALISYGARTAGSPLPTPGVVAVAFVALGFLPAVVVHSLVEGRETALGRWLVRPVVALAYVISAIAATLHLVNAGSGDAVPSRPALWLLTIGFITLMASLLLMTRSQPLGRRGIWVAAMSLFAVSAVHFGRHVGDESWWVELIGHHASLPLALTILHQDYRFAFADLFLKHAISLVLLVGVALGTFSAAAPWLRTHDAAVGSDPRTFALMIVLSIGMALMYPALQRLSARLVDRAVLKRPNYDSGLVQLADDLEATETEAAVVEIARRAVSAALGAPDVIATNDPLPESDSRLVVTTAQLKGATVDPSRVAWLRIRTVDLPHHVLAIGHPEAGRRLLSDDRHWLEAVSRLAARRLDAQRVAQERLSRNLREEAMQRLATAAELRALQAQLHPHFLFNALTTIGYLIKESPTRALDTLLHLTSVLRSVLRRGTTEFSTLGEEMELIDAYLQIEHARFEDRLRVQVDVPADLAAHRLPTLLLQPLVENAIKHGVGPRATGGTVAVSARAVAGRLRVRIQDSGLGFDVAHVATAAGVGLRSVAERLRVHYGESATLDITSSEETGTTVIIDLPLEVGQVTGTTSAARKAG
jgi:signal transduction histidine kinase